MTQASGVECSSATVRGRCAVWGVLNVTPDSFSDGGRFLDLERALERGWALVQEGADVVDVGGESTRPRGAVYGEGASPVTASEELARVLPVVRGLAQEGVSVSVDTTKAGVAAACLDAGARFVNDVSAQANEELLQVVARAGAQLVRMHNRGRGEVTAANTDYGGDVVDVVRRELLHELERAERAGVPPARVWLDPGIGFAKTARQSQRLLCELDAFVAMGQPVLVGASRKSFLATLAPNRDGGAPGPLDRVGATAATVAFAAWRGAAAVRVHDVAIMRQALLVAEAIGNGAPEVSRV